MFLKEQFKDLANYKVLHKDQSFMGWKFFQNVYFAHMRNYNIHYFSYISLPIMKVV